MQVMCIPSSGSQEHWPLQKFASQKARVFLYRSLQVPRKEGVGERSACTPATTNQKAMQKATRTRALYQTLASVKPNVPSMYCDHRHVLPLHADHRLLVVQLAANYAIQRPRSCTRPFRVNAWRLRSQLLECMVQSTPEKGKDISFFMTAFWLYVFH